MWRFKKPCFTFFLFAGALIITAVAAPTCVCASGNGGIESDTISAVLKKFELISSIPRCPGEEQKIVQMLKRWSKASDLEFKKDRKGNVLIKVPASNGWEQAPTIVLQGHLDMVCEKTPDSDHNFKNDPLKLKYESDWLTARGTTLGADNGIGIALCMALVEDESVSHPPLELLFTVEEEIGLKGAAELNPDFISAKILINVDSEGEGVLTIGSAGGTVTRITLPTATGRLPQEFDGYRLRVSGLPGGHSGLDIHKGRGNAIKITAGVMEALNHASPIRLVDLKGGSRANAIPQNTTAILAFDSAVIDRFNEIVATYQNDIRRKYAATESDVSITLTPADDKRPSRALVQKDTQKIFNLINVLPDGVAAMSTEFDGNVEISNNVGLAYFEKNTFTVISMERSADMKKMAELHSRIQSEAQNAGAEAKVVGSWPAWEPNQASALLQRAKKAYYKVFGQDPQIQVAHGGLECSVIAAKIPAVDMIAIGPTIENAHSANEALYIPSVGKLWQFLTALLASYGP
ncbi:MAG: beta-Ala-His dipeptidase [Deltaproteobacteria bacterium]|jgi:dipeptidase D|nr:beta-Ala-His dipeptidase [Deltaproteobacteria bacterium]